MPHGIAGRMPTSLRPAREIFNFQFSIFNFSHALTNPVAFWNFTPSVKFTLMLPVAV